MKKTRGTPRMLALDLPTLLNSGLLYVAITAIDHSRAQP